VENKFVSRRHAKIIRASDGIYIEDMDSTNGTFVNGQPVKKKKITASDKITLGKDYVLNFNKLLQQLPLSDEEFRNEFLKLKYVYENYGKTKVKIQSESQGKMMLKRSLPMALPGLLMVVLSLSFGGTPETIEAKQHADNIKLITTIIGGILSAVALVLGTLWGSKDVAKMPERLADLREQFLIDYSCPNCKREFGERPWELIKRQGKCPACQREFKLEN
jgi:DNA-directed RNA polymerase subunit RPC12/RpoP